MAGMNLSRGKTMATVNVLLQARNVRPVRLAGRLRRWRENNVDIVECVAASRKRINIPASAVRSCCDRDFFIRPAICRRFFKLVRHTAAEFRYNLRHYLFPCSGDITKAAKDPVVRPGLSGTCTEDGVLADAPVSAPLITCTVTAPDPGLETALKAMKLARQI